MLRNGIKPIPPKPFRPITQPVSASPLHSSKPSSRSELAQVTRVLPARKQPLIPITPRSQSPARPKTAHQQYVLDSEEVVVDALPPITSQLFHKRFAEMIVMCMHMCPFRDIKAEAVSIRRKLLALTQVAKFCNTFPITSLDDAEQTKLCQMLKANLFRKYVLMDPKVLLFDLFPPLHDKAWSHLEVIYGILTKFHSTCPGHHMFNLDFLGKLFKLFSTPDPEERVSLTQFLKEYTEKHHAHREFILEHVCAMIKRHIEVLENPFEVGLALPIMMDIFERQGHKSASMPQIEPVLFPLLHDRYLDFFNVDIMNLLEHYAAEKPENNAVIVSEILKRWPKTQISKMCIFIAILIDYVPKLNHEEMERILPAFLRILADACSFSSPRLADIVFSFFLITDFTHFMAEYPKLMMQTLVPALRKCSVEQWDASIRERAVVFLGSMKRFDVPLFDALSNETTDREYDKRESWSKIILACDEDENQEERLQMVTKLFPKPGAMPEVVEDCSIENKTN
jgi:hypothetical protein